MSYSLYKHKDDLRLAFKNISLLFWMNVTTALAWICYFFALRYLEPSLVNTIWAGLAPLVLSVLSLKFSLFDPKPIRSLERLFHIGIFIALLTLAWAILTNRTGVGGVARDDRIMGLIATIVSSISITVSVLLSKRMNVIGIGAEAIVGVRFVLTAIVAGLLVLLVDFDKNVSLSGNSLFYLMLATVFLLIIPIYVFQKGVQMTSVLTAETIVALGPGLIFLLQLLDSRIDFSKYSLIGVGLYTLCGVGAVVSRGLTKELPKPSQSVIK